MIVYAGDSALAMLGMQPTDVSIGTLGSTRAISKTSIFLVPPRTPKAYSTDPRMASGLPVGPVWWRYAPLMLSTTFSASSGYLVK